MGSPAGFLAMNTVAKKYVWKARKLSWPGPPAGSGDSMVTSRLLGSGGSAFLWPVARSLAIGFFRCCARTGLNAFAVGSPWRGFSWSGCEPVLAKGFLDAPGAGGPDALVDRQRGPQVRGGLAGVAVLEVSAAGAFQAACLL